MEERRELRRKRLALGLSQRKLGRLAEVSVFTIQGYENGRHNLRLSSKRQLTQAMVAHLAGLRLTARLRSEHAADLTLEQIRTLMSDEASR